MRDPRTWGLLSMAVVCASRSVAYLVPSGEILPVGLSTVAQVVDVRWFGVMWGLNTIALLTVAYRHSRASAKNAWVVFAPTLWGCMYFTGGLAGQPRGFSSAVLFWALAVAIASLMLVWPRPRRSRRT